MTIVITACAISLFLYCCLLINYRSGWNALKSFNKVQEGNVFISVVIAARNEEANLPALLRSLQSQSYPATKFEIIVVDDHSTDVTAKVASGYKNVQVISLSDHLKQPINSYKKKAIETGIKYSKGTLIVTTDADCIAHREWLSEIAAFYAVTESVFIVMPVKMLAGNSFIEKFQALDFMTLQGITGSAVQKKLHVMCNGANIAYTKEAYYAVGGFAGIDNVASGDDMLLMSKIYKRYPDKVQYLRSPNVTIETAPMKTIKDFISQRVRWASKSGSYTEPALKAILLIIYLLNLLLVLIPILGLAEFTFNSNTDILLLWVLFVLVKTAVELFFLWDVANFYNYKKMLGLFIFFQPVHIIYTVVAGTLGLSGNYIWKGRKVK